MCLLQMAVKTMLYIVHSLQRSQISVSMLKYVYVCVLECDCNCVQVSLM